MSNTDTPTEITIEMMKDLQTQLRGYDLSWKDKLVKQIKEDKTIDLKYRKNIKQQKLYNVLNGIVRDPAWKLMVYTQAVILRDAYKSQLNEALSN
jgi:hypothetical protein